MIFSKIDFINLLPFYIYLKKHLKSSRIKQTMEYYKSYPSMINKKFKQKTIDGAFISSIKSKNCKCMDIGIIAKNEVLSVLSFPGEFKRDFQSDTSNILAKVLKCDGEVIIGDKALIYYFKGEKRDFIDLAKVWNEKYNLPFVFARLCFNKENIIFTRVCNNFVKSNVKIPQYVLKKYVKKSGLTRNQIMLYLDKISYTIDYKEKQSLKKFFKLAKELK